MRWLLSAHGASPFGGERVLLAMAERLAGRGHDVTAEFPHHGPAVDLARALDGVEVWVSGRPRLPRNAGELLRYVAGAPFAYGALLRRMRRERYDIVWVHSIYNPIAVIAARRAAVPTVWHLHECNLTGIAGRLLARVVRHGCDRAVAVSEFARRSYAGLERWMAVVPNALLRAIPALDPRTDGPFTVLYIGQLERRKRVSDVVAAIAAVPEGHLVLVGAGKAARQVEAAVRRAGVAARVELAGLQLDIIPHLARCDCVVMPSRDESFGLVALEAMAAGRPIIAAQSGALPEVLGDAALYYPLGDAHELAQQIRRLRDQPALAQVLRARGLRRVRAFSLERMLDLVEAHAAALRHPARGAAVAGRDSGVGLAAPDDAAAAWWDRNIAAADQDGVGR